MRALVYESFAGPMTVREEPAPAVPRGGVVVRVGASGICRSDWHGWQGHDPDIALPHVPGHELAGTRVGRAGVTRLAVGDRVTVPFVCGCGRCPVRGRRAQVCERQTQPGFTHWGSFAERVALARGRRQPGRPARRAVFAVAAAWAAATPPPSVRSCSQGRVRPGEWVAVHGCGGVGLSAVQVAVGGRRPGGRRRHRPRARSSWRARSAQRRPSTPADRRPCGGRRELTGGGAHCHWTPSAAPTPAPARSSACGRGAATCRSACCRRRGARAVPMDQVVALELELLGSHGMPAHAYPEMLGLIASGRLQPERLITRELALDEAPAAFAGLGSVPGIAVVTRF